MKILKWIGNFVSSWIGAIVVVLCLIFFVGQGFVIPSRSMVGSLYEGDMMFVKKYAYGLTIPKIPWLEIPILPDFNGNKHLVEGERPKRGDLVVFNPPGDDKTYYIKRAFAIGGDKVVFAPDGMYLRPFEGDSYIDSHFKGYETKEFLGEKYVKEPYSLEYKGIHYGEKDSKEKQFQSYTAMLYRAKMGGFNNTLPSGSGVAMNYNLENENYINDSENTDSSFFYKEIAPDSFFMVGDNRDNSDDSRFWGVIDYSRVVGKPWFSYFSITLADSIESGANESINRYKVRWDRMFKSIETLQKEAKEFEGECRYYEDHDCKLRQ